MTCECSKLDYGALLVMPLECKTILGPFERDFVLTDVHSGPCGKGGSGKSSHDPRVAFKSDQSTKVWFAWFE
jgi:hypothetical protein